MMSKRLIEELEDRRLLSAVHLATHLIRPQNIAGTHFAAAQTEQFSATPSAVQSGLNALAPSAISASQTVYVHTVNSTTMYYGVVLTNSSGPSTRLVVDENGLPAGNEKVTFGQLSNGPSNDQAIATALQKLAPGSVTIGASQPVFVRSSQGTTTFSVSLTNSNGTVTKISVDGTGATVTAPKPPAPVSANTTTFGALSSTIQNGFKALTSATIDSSQTVSIDKLSSSTTLYSINIAGTSTTQGTHITVDENGLPAGNERVLFSQLQAGPANDQAIASGLQSLAPSGVTIAGTQDVFVRTYAGMTTYSVFLTGSGTDTTITVNSSGKAVTQSMPSVGNTTFGAAPAAVQAGLQAIAPSGTTISSSQSVFVLTINSTTSYYSVDLAGSTAMNWWGTRLTVDENGLPAGNQQVTYGQLQGGPAADKTVATALQTLAGSTTISSTQTVYVQTVSGLTTFTINLTNSNGTTTEITVDSSGTAVSPPGQQGGGRGFGFPGGGGVFPIGGFPGGGDSAGGISGGGLGGFGGFGWRHGR